MKRIYFLVPNIEITHKIVEELQSEGIEDRYIHILAKRDTPLEGLPEAGVSIKTDFLPALERGIALGGSTGLLAGLIGLRFAGFAIAGGTTFGDHYCKRNHRVSDGRFSGNECGKHKVKKV